jgi:hypothetical protein
MDSIRPSSAIGRHPDCERLSMRPIAMDELQRIVTEVAHDHDSRIEVMGVMRTGDGSQAEVFVTLRDCTDPPCEFVVGVERTSSEAAIRRAVAAKIDEHTCVGERRRG